MFAFPSPHDPKTGTMQLGMTLRDYFAAKAMQVFVKEMLSTEPCEENLLKMTSGSYRIADAMMKARDA